MSQERLVRKKVLVAKLGLDGHDRGAKVITMALRDAGFRVVYLGVHQAPEDLVRTALEEDVEVIGVSILSGSHEELVSDLVRLAREKGVDVPIVVGGIIPPEDVPKLKELGIYEVLPPGTPLAKVVEVFMKAVGERK
ncbi:MAG: cobalamin B12-binding domain-containing protein [Sulfolobales archaeon]|nr:cobalamin B12-binding domain-containing protein [Sulfolobales archaeon]MDW8082592.1 cobalamin B12-binding domain-containing protein [Sulfolobales archaeon]